MDIAREYASTRVRVREYASTRVREYARMFVGPNIRELKFSDRLGKVCGPYFIYLVDTKAGNIFRIRILRVRR